MIKLDLLIKEYAEKKSAGRPHAHQLHAETFLEKSADLVASVDAEWAGLVIKKRSPGNAMAAVDARAVEIRKAKPSLTAEQAWVEAYNEDPTARNEDRQDMLERSHQATYGRRSPEGAALDQFVADLCKAINPTNPAAGLQVAKQHCPLTVEAWRRL